jgi:hypothetical protein
MNAIGSQIRHSAVRSGGLVLGCLQCNGRGSETGEGEGGKPQERCYTNIPRIVICFVGNGGVRLRGPVCPAAGFIFRYTLFRASMYGMYVAKLMPVVVVFDPSSSSCFDVTWLGFDLALTFWRTTM